MRRVDLVLSRLAAVHRCGGDYRARCPAHGDRHPSLSVREADDGRVLVHCFAGCRFEEIVAAIGLSPSDLSPNGANQMVKGYPPPKGTLPPADATRQQRVKAALSRWRERRLAEIDLELAEIEEKSSSITEYIAVIATLLKYGRQSPDTKKLLEEFDRLRDREAELETKRTWLNAPSSLCWAEVWRAERRR